MRKSRFAELRGFRMLKLWEDFLNQPSVFISLCALVISFLALSLQFVSFKLNGSRIKVNLSLTFYEPTTGVFFNYPISSTRKNVLSDPVTQKFRTGNIRKEFNNAGGIELLKVTISNHGRFPASIKDISFGYGVHGKEYQHYFSKYTIGLPPYFFPSYKTIPSLPHKIEGGDEFVVYYNYWDAFHDLQDAANNQKSRLTLHAYVKLASKKNEKKSKDALKLQTKQSTTLDCNRDKIPLRIVLARFFYGNQSEQNKLIHTDNTFLLYYGNFSLASQSYLAGRWPESYTQQMNLIRKFFNTCHIISGYYYNSEKPNCSYSSIQPKVRDDEVANQIALDLPLHIEKWKSRIDWSDINQPDLYDKMKNRLNR